MYSRSCRSVSRRLLILSSASLSSLFPASLLLSWQWLTALCTADSLPLSCLTDMQKDLSESSFCPGLQGWLDNLLSSPSSSLPDASLSVATLLRACNTALSIARDTGYEGALHFLGSACAEADKSAQHVRPKQTAAQHGAVQQGEAEGKATQQAEDNIPATSASTDSPIASFLKALSAKVCNLSNVVDCLRPVNPDSQVHGSSKFQELVRFLVQLKAEKDAWHGMVFVRERQAVFQLTRMLQSAPQLADINFHPFTGQAKTHTVRPASGSTSSSATPLGMKTSERKNIFQRFRFAKGREVLVATSAAEEGIDVPGCEFVVCYTTVESGRELTQKQGRARAMVSKFVEFVESNTDDAIMQSKARSEQLSSQMAQKLHLSNAKCC